MVLKAQDSSDDIMTTTSEPFVSSPKTGVRSTTLMATVSATTTASPDMEQSFDSVLEPEAKFSPTYDSVFTFPVADGAVSTTTTGSCVDEPEELEIVTSSGMESLSATDSGLVSGSSSSTVFTSDYWQQLEHEASATQRTASVSSAGSRSTPKRSLTQKFIGMFSKTGDKSQKSTNDAEPGTSRDRVLTPGSVTSSAELTSLSPKDQKILSLMVERKEAEKHRSELRDRNQLKSDKEQVPRNRTRPSAQSRPVNSGTASRTTCARPQVVSSNYNQNGSDDGIPTTPSCGSRRSSIVSPLASDARIQPLDDTRLKFAMKTDKRRQSVEQRLEQQRRELEEYQRQLKLKQELELQRANSLRLSREQQQATRARLANVKAQQKHEQISKQKEQSVNDLSILREEIDSKLAAAEAKVQKKKEEVQKSRAELKTRMEASKQRQRQMEAEIENWQQELAKYNHWQGNYAEKAARQAATLRSSAACRLRLEKEKKQQENMKKLMTDQEKRLNEMEATIESKVARTQAMQREKEDHIQRSRNRAMAMKQVRDELRAHYSMNDLDQLARQVALENRLLSRYPDSSVQSSVMNSMLSLA